MDEITRDEDGNFVVTAPDGHPVTVSPAKTKPKVRFKNVKRLKTRLVQTIAGNLARINAEDFNPQIHRDPPADQAEAPAPSFVAPVTVTETPITDPDPETVEPVDYRELDLTSLVAVLADAPADQVSDIEAFEKANKGRKTVLKAVASRLAELDKE